MEHVRKRLLRGDGLPVEGKFPARRGSHDVDISGGDGGPIARPQDLPGVLSNQCERGRQQENCSSHLRIRTNERSISSTRLTPAIAISTANSARRSSITRAT